MGSSIQAIDRLGDRNRVADVSRQGWGAYCQGVSTGSRWALEETSYHINCLELLAGSLAVKCFTKERAKAQVLLLMVNISAVYIYQQDGGNTLTPPVIPCQEPLGLVSQTQSFSESSIHSWDPECSGRPGIQSISSCQQLETESSSFQLSESDLDLPICITSNNSTGPVRELEPRPLSSEHRRFHTGLVNIYAFPQFALMGRCLSQIQSHHVTHSTCSSSLASSTLAPPPSGPMHRRSPSPASSSRPVDPRGQNPPSQSMIYHS